MPKTSQMRESKFLKKEDVGNGALMTVRGCNPHNVAMQGAGEEMKWCLEFEESEKPLVLNGINIQLCEKIFGSDDTDDWLGKRIVLYTDPTVSYGGKIVGGIRVRAPKQANQVKKAAPAKVPEPVTEDLDVEDVPFAWVMPLVLPALGLLSMGVLA